MHLRMLILGILVLIGCIIYVRNYFTEGFQTTQSQYQYTGLYVAPPANDTLKTRSNFWEILNKEKSGQPITRGSDSGSAGSLLNKVMNPEPNDVFKMVYPKYISMYALAKYEYNPIHARKALINDFDTLQIELETAVEQEQSDRDKFTGSSSKPIEESCKTLNSITVGMYGKLIQIQRNIKNLNNSGKLAENLHKENIELQKAVSSGSSKPCVWQDMQPSDDCIKLATMSEKLFPLLPTFDNFNIKILTDGQAIQDMIDVLLQAYKGIGCPLTNSSVLGSSGGSNPLNVIDIFSETYIDSLDIIDTDSLYETLQILSPYYISQNMIKFISNRLTKTKTLDIETSTTADYLSDIGEITQSIVSLNTDVSPLQSGQVYDKTNNNFKNCPPGYYCPPISSTPIQCPVGSYCPGANTSGTTIERPIPCPPGDYSPPGASMISQCSKTAPLGYYIDKDGKAIQCRTGHYCINGTITMCPSGTYNMKKGMSSIDSCLICPPGSFCPTTTSIAPCPKGTYNPGTGKSRTGDCIKCGAGKTCFEKGLSSPIDCPVGTFSSVVGLTGSCTPVQGGYYLTGTGNTTSDTRKACTVGNYCPGGSGQQIPCPAGSYCPNEQMAAPTPCPGGRYGNTTGLTMPACNGVCAAGYYCSEGSTTPTQTVCPAGYYCSEGSSAPIRCPRGSYCPEKSTSPTKCPAGTYNNTELKESVSQCIKCPGGYFCQAGTINNPMDGSSGSAGSGEILAKICTSGYYCTYGCNKEEECSRGNYCPVGSAAEIPCPAGTKCPNTRMSVPEPCPVGTYNGDTGKQDCTPCNEGTYNGREGAIRCTECPAGTKCPNTRMSVPEPCPVGQTSTGGSSSCTPCPAGTYCPTSGGSAAILCPIGTYCPGGGSQPTQCMRAEYCPNPGLITPSLCPEGKQCNNLEGSRPPEDCPPGTYSTGGQLFCNNCPSGTYGTGGGIGPACSGLCPAGYYCPPGTTSPSSGSGSGSGRAQPCPIGHYCPSGTGTTCREGQRLSNGRCETCPNGQTPSTTGVCTNCPAGMYSWNTVPTYFSLEEGSITETIIPGRCYDCPIGRYCNNGRMDACPNGTSTSETGSITVVDCKSEYCPPGYMCRDGNNILCPQGTYNSATGKSSCITVPDGNIPSRYVLPELSLGAYSYTPCEAGEGTEWLDTTLSTNVKIQYDGYGYYDSQSSLNGYFSIYSYAYNWISGVRLFLNTCSICESGYRSGSGTGCLSTCPSGFFQDPNNASKCISLCSNGQGLNNNNVCAACPIGQYSLNSYCTTCPAGTFCSNTGMSVPEQCPAGTYSSSTGNTSINNCTKCPAGKYSSSTGNTSVDSCINCPAGSYSSSTGSTSCSRCPAGKYSSSTGNTSVDSCINCAPGTYVLFEGASSCSVCREGTYCDNLGMTRPKNCPAGTYSSSKGNTSLNNCIRCPAGTYASTTGNTSVNSCNNCPAGTYASTTGNTSINSCFPCPFGQISTERSSSCRPCPAGTWNTGSNQTICTPCPNGTYCTEGGFPIACYAGTYTNSTTSKDKCTVCSSGQSTWNGATEQYTGATQCSACSTYPNNYCINVSNMKTWFDAGLQGLVFYGVTPDLSLIKVNCPALSSIPDFSPSQYQIEAAALYNLCNSCPPGTYGPSSDPNTCLYCPAGTFSSSRGSFSCTSCPVGSFSSGGSSTTSCSLCPPGTYSSVRSSSCTPV